MFCSFLVAHCERTLSTGCWALRGLGCLRGRDTVTFTWNLLDKTGESLGDTWWCCDAVILYDTVAQYLVNIVTSTDIQDNMMFYEHGLLLPASRCLQRHTTQHVSCTSSHLFHSFTPLSIWKIFQGLFRRRANDLAQQMRELRQEHRSQKSVAQWVKVDSAMIAVYYSTVICNM